TSDEVQSAIPRKPCQCEPCIVSHSHDSARETACSVRLSWCPASCRPQPIRSERKRESCPIVAARKTRQPPVRRSMPAESRLPPWTLKAAFVSYPCPNIILSAHV